MSIYANKRKAEEFLLVCDVDSLGKSFEGLFEALQEVPLDVFHDEAERKWSYDEKEVRDMYGALIKQTLALLGRLRSGKPLYDLPVSQHIVISQPLGNLIDVQPFYKALIRLRRIEMLNTQEFFPPALDSAVVKLGLPALISCSGDWNKDEPLLQIAEEWFPEDLPKKPVEEPTPV